MYLRGTSADKEGSVGIVVGVSGERPPEITIAFIPETTL
jgi:hypothetical protein